MPQGKYSTLQGKPVTTINEAVELRKIAFAVPGDEEYKLSFPLFDSSRIAF
jgi:hypothetical protein